MNTVTEFWHVHTRRISDETYWMIIGFSAERPVLRWLTFAYDLASSLRKSEDLVLTSCNIGDLFLVFYLKNNII